MEMQILRTLNTSRRPFLHSWRQLSSQVPSTAATEAGPLAELREAVLAYDGSPITSSPVNFTIHPASTGGHALIGSNGTGKSLISIAIASQGSANYLRAGQFYTDKPWYSTTVAHVSFESHEEILEKGGPVTKAISSGGQLSKAAQFLIVRFGLYPFLHREVGTLSTGEIRKVMLVRALAQRPRLLILDNAFDGLDVPSREKLKDLVSRTIQGFRPDILVQAVSARDTAHTQVLLLTHRPEEVVEEIQHITVLHSKSDILLESVKSFSRNHSSSQALFATAFGSSLDETIKPWSDDTLLPSIEEIRRIWEGSHVDPSDKPLVVADNLSIRRGDAILLRNLHWQVNAGERWLVAGGNGAGKSTLSRLLAKAEGGIDAGSLEFFIQASPEHDYATRPGVAWMSTERHMKTSKSTEMAQDILLSHGSTPKSVGHAVAHWMGIQERTLYNPFSQLSQGEQKMVLLASAIASRHPILVLDEPCQGLDLMNCRRLLGLMERICQATNLTLIYITHHLEELIPSMTHVIHLAGGQDVYQGSLENYDPLAMPQSDSGQSLSSAEHME